MMGNWPLIGRIGWFRKFAERGVLDIDVVVVDLGLLISIRGLKKDLTTKLCFYRAFFFTFTFWITQWFFIRKGGSLKRSAFFVLYLILSFGSCSRCSIAVQYQFRASFLGGFFVA